MNAVGAGLAAASGETLADGRLDGLTVALALEGFLVSVAVGVSMRLFRLYFHTQLSEVLGGSWR